ncbi:MAG: hypothetical protein A2849_02250 [Candidatus Taylorbacteria bacterium RIFCSPHIGHO2_01_FULL_51_15]|uniref:LTD domain-containing protein n=1 Tax=Candidatus Taylorbacteria bacterium RIFCSPHIGHO2_01_FULL_51_15 TaxID=1802304 RepID=A0A1G2MB87_9BACT|nr:MAG: hypothetical protein A2849_02250 [Candidatus Taylorbacteria bacterium RIFCSPHIGHO2_01_FULL_51_15]
MDDIKWFAGFLIILGVLWLGTRGKGVERQTERATTTPAVSRTLPREAPPRNGGARNAPLYPPAGTIISESVLPDTLLDSNVSPLRGQLSVSSIQRSGPAEKEYVVIQASAKNQGDVELTGLVLGSGVSLNAHAIGRGWSFVTLGSMGEGEIIYLRPGARAYVGSGRAPLGHTTGSPNSGAFQLNLCSGYFEQGLTFYPSLPLQCPRPIDDPLPLPPNELSDACYDYLKRVKRCTVPSSVPENLKMDGSCQAHVFNRINYNQCYANYKDLPTFFTGEWRIYLGRTSELWHDRHDLVELVDREGRLIDSRSY